MEDFESKFQEHGWTDPDDYHLISDEQLKEMDFKSGHIHYFNKYFREKPEPLSPVTEEEEVAASTDTKGDDDMDKMPSGARRMEKMMENGTGGGAMLADSPSPS